MKTVNATAPARVLRGTNLSAEFRQKFVGMIRRLEAAKTGKYAGTKGVHSVYDGVNQELRRVGMDPIATVQELVALGDVQSHPVRGGARIYIKGEMPTPKASGKAAGLLD